jgi:hypothetical protein
MAFCISRSDARDLTERVQLLRRAKAEEDREFRTDWCP